MNLGKKIIVKQGVSIKGLMFSEEFGDLCRRILAKQNGNIKS